MKANNSARVALEECAPNVFIIHDIRVHPFLHGEGTRTGNRFVLTSWRRDGLVARIRERGLVVATLEAQIAALPALPTPPVITEVPRWHRLGHADERWSYYDPATRAIVPCVLSTHADTAGVWLQPGWVVRRRRGRGASEWYRTVPQGAESVQYIPVSDDDAILLGLAQAAIMDHAPLVAHQPDPDHVTLTTPLLPHSYQQCAIRWANNDRSGVTWLMPRAHLVWMQRLLKRLGILLVGESDA